MSRILIHTLLFPPDGVSTAYLMGELALELARHGHDVSVLTSTPHYNVETQALEQQPLTRVRGSWLYRSTLGVVPAWHVSMPMKSSR
jgi:hypothetical protein